MPYAANLEKLALPQADDIVANGQACYRTKGVDMSVSVLMPALSPTMTEGTLQAGWSKRETASSLVTS